MCFYCYKNSLYVLSTSLLSDELLASIFFPILWIVFLLLMSFEVPRFNYQEVQFVYFSFCMACSSLLYGVVSKKSLPYPRP